MSAFLRGAGFLALWIVLMGTKPADVAAGVVPAAAAAWASLRLMPPGRGSVRIAELSRYALRFLRQSIAAGWDVARRAFSPALPLQTGFVRYVPTLPPGDAREAFVSVTSLLPGTVPVNDDGGAVTYHCLDTSQPIAAQLADEERAFAQVLRGTSPHG